MFNLRSFFENPMEIFSTSSTGLFDRFRQTVDDMKYSLSPINITETDAPPSIPSNETSYNLIPSVSASSSSSSSNSSNTNLCSARSNSTPWENSPLNVPVANGRRSKRQSILRRNVSESNKGDDHLLNRAIYHDNPPIDVHALLNINNSNHEKFDIADRSRSLIRQSTDTTTTFPIRQSIRRMESVEIPGLNGLKSIRYIKDNLGKLEPNLYIRQTQVNDQSYNSGTITFTLFYNPPLASLIITIVSMNYLPYRDVNSKVLPNPFVKVTLLPDRRKKYQTKVYKHSQSVQFNEAFEFQIHYEQLSKRTLLLSVYDFRRSSKRNLIGTVKMDDIWCQHDITSNHVSFTEHIIPGTEVSFCHLRIQIIERVKQ